MIDTCEPTDMELVATVRAGDIGAYHQLYQRNADHAHAAARSLAPNKADADDAVAEAFASVLDAIRSGLGPRENFRGYLLRAVRNSVMSQFRHKKRITVVEDCGLHEWTEQGQPERTVERNLAQAAFARLPRRWQLVLWLTEIEAMTPAQAAPILRLRPNAVAALAYRARAGLRRAYLWSAPPNG